MITSTIGRIFLDAYNEKFNTSYDAKSFFVEVYYPLFFDSPKYLQWVQNSPFVQMKKGQKVETLSPEERLEKLKELHAKIDCGMKDASVAIGYAASEEKEFATTSGQVSNIDIEVSKEDIYYSWIGSSLGVGLQGGMSILFSKPQILLDLFEGWRVYRTALDNTDILKGNQINTWNGQWLAHRYGKLFVQNQPMANFMPFENKDNVMSVKVQSWTMVLIGISRYYADPQMMGYVYSFGQTNTTIGFIPFNLSQIRRPIEFYQSVFGMNEGTKAERLWGTEYGLRTSCRSGVIGLKAMEPKGLKTFIEGTKIPKSAKDEQQEITYNTYIIWILAMLNNQELWSKSFDYAQVLLDYSKSGKSSKTVNSQRVTQILSATNKKSFISALTEIVGEVEEKKPIIELAELVNSMPTDNVPYFLTLLRFSYASKK